MSASNHDSFNILFFEEDQVLSLFFIRSFAFRQFKASINQAVKLSFVILFLLAAGRASAVVVADYSVATNAPSGSWNVNWDYVYRYKNSSAVAVGSHWLLTAAPLQMTAFPRP